MDIWRNIGVGEPAPGYDALPVWEEHLVGIRCFLWNDYRLRNASGERVRPESEILLMPWRILCPADIDVHEGDEVRGVRDRRGQVIMHRYLDIAAIVVRNRHYNVLVVDQRT